jgi:hypothetical protein
VLQEPLKVSYRPLTFYVIAEIAAAVKHIMLVAAGFVGHTYGAYTYYTFNLPTERQAAHGYVLGTWDSCLASSSAGMGWHSPCSIMSYFYAVGWCSAEQPLCVGLAAAAGACRRPPMG